MYALHRAHMWRRSDRPQLRRKHAQMTRVEPVKVTGSRWNRPCLLEPVCVGSRVCVCNIPRIAIMRSRGCNRVACSFLKWCRCIPERAEASPPWRGRWWDATQEYAAYLMANRMPDNFT